MTFTRAIGVSCNAIIRVIVRGLALSKIHPNALTFIGLLINIGAAALMAVGSFRWAAVVVIAAAIFDMVDGRVARETNQVTKFGGFFDSVIDRYSDLFLLMAFLVYYLRKGDSTLVILVSFVSVGTALIPYVRARAEAARIECSAGLMERAERIILITIGILSCWMEPVLWILAILTHYTVLERIHHVWKKLRIPEKQ